MSKPIPEGRQIKGSIRKQLDSRFISSLDLVGRGVVWMTIKELRKIETLKYENGQTDHNVVLVYFEETPKPLKLNATNVKALILRFGSVNVEDWAGGRIPLHAEEGVYFGQAGYAVRIPDVDREK